MKTTLKELKYMMPKFVFIQTILFLALILFSILVPVFFPVDLGATNLAERLIPPSFLDGGTNKYFLGTDSLGRDFMIRIFYATRNSLFIAFSALLVSTAIGFVLGVLAGLYRGVLDTIISFILDVRLSIPGLIIAVVLVTVFGSSKLAMILIIGFSGFASFTRLVRGQTIQLREANFIENSRALGASNFRILTEHVFFNISSPLIVRATMQLNSFIVVESSLSFLGLGIQPPDVSLGVMISEGRDYMINMWWLTMLPSFIIIFIVVSILIIGDWIRDMLDPQLRNK